MSVSFSDVFDHTCSEERNAMNVCVFVRISKTIFLCMLIDCEQISVHFDQFFLPRAIFRLKVEFDFDFDETSFISIKKTTQDARAHFNPHAQMSDFCRRCGCSAFAELKYKSVWFVRVFCSFILLIC